MRTRPYFLAIAHLIGIAALVVQPDGARAQPSVKEEDRVAVLHRLISDVETRRRVLVKQRGDLVALSADQLGELFASAILTDELPADSIASRIRKVRDDSDFWLSLLKRELASLEASEGAPADVQLQWNGAPGTWSMACGGRYPPVVEGRVDEVYMIGPPFGNRDLHVGLYRGHAFFTPLTGTVVGTAASGERRPAEMPGNDFQFDVATLVWDAEVTETSPAGDGVDGTIVASGALTYTGNEGSCRGRWHSP